LNIDPPKAERFLDVASLFYVVLILDPAEVGPFSEDGNPVIQDNFWIPARRSAMAGMTSDEIYAGVIFESPQPQFSGLTLILKKKC
jgi:hypothetical protein